MPACLADQFGFTTDANVSPRVFAAVCSNNHIELAPLASMFIHGGWIHLIGNMIFLWVFGDNVEDAVGHIRYAVFYVVAGLAATTMHVFVNTNSLTPTIGASGAIAGVLGAYLMLYPRATVAAILPIFIIFWVPFYVPAVFLIGLWFVMQLLNGYASLAPTDVVGAGGVAWFAHIGGFVAGFILVRLFTLGRPPPPKVATHYRRRSAW
jgi:membrane associated rhomboid family serine protease